MVLYFSGTGNSRHAAKVIAKASGDEMISINDRLKFHDYSPVHSDKAFVFVGPVYGGRFPRVMEKYIETVTFTGSKNAYFAATCAQTPWNTVKYVNRLCEQKNFSMMGFNSVVMPQGYIAGGGTQPKNVSDEILSKAEPVIQKIANNIASGKNLKLKIRAAALCPTYSILSCILS
ncbi:MAG: EFR1 family ferrodoxin [Oscillospiraceae bacterium]